MKRYSIVIIVCFLAFQATFGQEGKGESVSTTQEYPALKKQAQYMSDATLKGDFQKVLDSTHPKAIPPGGKQKMLAFLKAEFAKMKADGIELESITLGEPEQIMAIGKDLFAVVPFTMVMKGPGKVGISNTHMVGISNDNGSNWKFVGSADQKRFDLMFPKAAGKIKIPEKKQIITNN